MKPENELIKLIELVVVVLVIPPCPPQRKEVVADNMAEIRIFSIRSFAKLKCLGPAMLIIAAISW